MVVTQSHSEENLPSEVYSMPNFKLGFFVLTKTALFAEMLYILELNSLALHLGSIATTAIARCVGAGISN